MLGCILFLIIYGFPLAIQSQRHLNYQRQPQHYERMLSIALGFPKDRTLLALTLPHSPVKIFFSTHQTGMVPLARPK